jgi:hypothetical protein
MIQFLPDFEYPAAWISEPHQTIQTIERKRNPTDPFEAADHIQPTGHVPASAAAAALDGSSYLSSA